ncbi:hypothetical protein V1264_007318 [Littorina saxatilis]|uniref:Uncharacterized protein n=1 Tax=Littorina saxatilis TaxID=31220 RepID=A0AAN9AUQ7_9CAEN
MIDWYPYSNGQCSGPTPHLCVSPGLMTQANRDETDPGGCHAWGTQARHDAWFEGIQICFRWEQCTGEWKKEFCKSISDLTTTYAHDDDIRGKECQVSWKVVIPANAPVWQQNFRLCFLWRPEQEDENCGGEQCAVGNWSRFDPEQMKLLQKCTTPTAPGGDALKIKNTSFLALVSLVCFLYLLLGYTV